MSLNVFLCWPMRPLMSVLEQLTICVRYLTGTGSNIEINEDFLKFYEIRSLAGQDLVSAILNGMHLL